MAVTCESKTICWKCANACNGGCSWSRSGKPVSGWTADKNEETESYTVVECPQFISDAEASVRRIDRGGAEALVAGILNQVVADYIRGSAETAIECERFVKGRFFRSLSDLDPEYLIKLMRQRKNNKSVPRMRFRDAGKVSQALRD